jgi:hypothetical protein
VIASTGGPGDLASQTRTQHPIHTRLSELAKLILTLQMTHSMQGRPEPTGGGDEKSPPAMVRRRHIW